MKRFFIILLTIIAAHCMLAAADLVEGSLDSLAVETRIAASLDCSQCVYRPNKTDLPFENFLLRARRDTDWEERSLDYFVENFNDRITEEGMVARKADQSWECRYELVIVPSYVKKNGSLNGLVHVIDTESGNSVATISFSVGGDDDDSIALRDPMKELGDQVGKIFVGLLKGKPIKIKTKK